MSKNRYRIIWEDKTQRTKKDTKCFGVPRKVVWKYKVKEV